MKFVGATVNRRLERDEICLWCWRSEAPFKCGSAPGIIFLGFIPVPQEQRIEKIEDEEQLRGYGSDGRDSDKGTERGANGCQSNALRAGERAGLREQAEPVQ